MMTKSKVLAFPVLLEELQTLRRQGKRIVFTNGCFDLLHPGHVRYLRAARELGDVLVVAINSDASVRRIKGPKRPLVPAQDRAELLAALEMVDYVTIFDEDTPLDLIEKIAPDVLVKGGDWPPDTIVGASVVQARGGVVRSVPYAAGYSTSGLVKRILERERECGVPSTR
ncbi:Bifunctional protein HldE [bacterium HR30]|nr:Bifunctional protein HldE [bacterium HR30]